MTTSNRRLHEIRRQKIYYEDLLDQSQTITDCLIYTGKLESLTREEKEILTRYKGEPEYD